MLRGKIGSLDQMSSVTSETVPGSDQWYEWSFGIAISGVATVAVQWSTDGTRWHTAATAVESSDSVFASGYFPYLRVAVTDHTSGNVDVDYTAFGGNPLRGR